MLFFFEINDSKRLLHDQIEAKEKERMLNVHNIIIAMCE